MQTVALGVYLTETTHNPVWLGLLTVAAWSPALIGSPLGGVIADRWNRQRWIQANNVVMTATATTLAIAGLTHHLSPELACYLAVVEGLAGSASWSAWQSLLPDLVDRDEVLAAVSLSSAQFNLGRIIGPMLAGIALAFGSPSLCFALNAASFAFVVLMFSFVRSPARPKPTTRVRVWAETVVGARRAWEVKGCRYPILGIGTIALIGSPFIALIPAMAIQTLHAGRAGVPWLVTAQGVGAVLGALTLPPLAKRTSRVKVLKSSVAGVAVGLALYGAAPNLALAVAALALLGAAYVGTITGLNTSVQLHAPIKERSRILSLYTLSLSIFYPIGALAQATIAKYWGVRPVTLSAAGLLAVVFVLVTVRRPLFWAEIGSTSSSPANLLAE
jgi:MFS family permease